jgi:hypothetical protein
MFWTNLATLLPSAIFKFLVGVERALCVLGIAPVLTFDYTELLKELLHATENGLKFRQLPRRNISKWLTFFVIFVICSESMQATAKPSIDFDST